MPGIFLLALLPACRPEAITKASLALEASAIPPAVRSEILSRMRGSSARFLTLLSKVEKEGAGNPGLIARVDKGKALPKGFVPADLEAVEDRGISVSRPGHKLRRPALAALAAMDKAARASGIELLVSSAYRSYAYQAEVFARNVKELGESEARRVSAEPGMSQHQLGTAVDFGSITDAFADTRAGRWLVANAARFGWSLSYPKGMEGVTGYVWESWHYRFIGSEAVALQEEYFGGIQHYLMLFLDSYL